MTPDELLDEIDHFFNGVPLHVASSRRVEDLYEAFLMGLVLEAGRNLGCKVDWRDVDGTPATEVRLRGGPGEVYTRPFTHASLSLGSETLFEVHVGVMVVGSSTAHECDVVVLHAGVGSVRRSRRQTPLWNDVVLAIEAKAYTTTPIRLNLGRQAVGLAVELRHQRLAFVASRAIDASATVLMNAWLVLDSWAGVKPATQAAADLTQAIEAHLLA
jgi:hypothetical protein